ncbi:hypothetical protein V2W45_1210073, partial [Cenococcum geophilum]
TRPSAAPHQENGFNQLLTTMPQHNVPESVYREGRVALAISALKQNQFQSVRRAAATYNVDDRTLRRRRAGIQSRR